jgi:hypothetical protein
MARGFGDGGGQIGWHRPAQCNQPVPPGNDGDQRSTQNPELMGVQ